MTPDQTSESAELVVFSDYLCPFCYLGKESMERYLEDRDEDVAVEWRPFDIQGRKRQPDGSIADVDDGKDEAYFERAKRNVERLSEEFGVEMTTDIPEDVDSWNAQKLSLHVDRTCSESEFQALHERLFEALWVEKRDIGDVDVLVELGEDVGLEGERIREVLADDELDERLEAAFDEARQLGIRGIPAFVSGGRLAQGAIPPEKFEELLEA